MTFEAEFIDAEYIDAEYAKYVNAAQGPANKSLGWTFWVVLSVLALVIYTAAFLFQTHRTVVVAPPNLDLHDCTLPEVQVEMARPNSAEHDIIAPYAHSVCREGDVRLWESTH